jgi:hypothetical protein
MRRAAPKKKAAAAAAAAATDEEEGVVLSVCDGRGLPDAPPGAVTSLTRRGYGFEKATCTPAFLDALRRCTTVRPRVPPAVSNVAPRAYPVHQESVSKLYIPKYLGLARYGAPVEDKTLDDGVGCGADDADPWRVVGCLRESQLEPVDAYLSAARDPLRRGGIINVACGNGKTVMALHILSRLRVRALVVVHKTFLVDQWVERIAEFLPGARVGRLQGPVCDVQGKHVVICMLQSLTGGREYDLDGFGAVVVDECHHTSAEVFSRALHRLNCRHSLGLSATVRRKDGLSHVFQWFLGPVVYSNKAVGRRRAANAPPPAEVMAAEFACQDPAYREERYVFGCRVDIVGMVSNVCRFAPRTAFVADAVMAALAAHPERKVLVLSERRSHLVDIHAAVTARSNAIAPTRGAAVSIGFYVGGVKQEELKRAEAADVILGTFSMAAEGMDIPALNTLVLASPKSDVEQAVGRIMRVQHGRSGPAPLVIDVADTFSVFRSQFARRLRFYASSGFALLPAGAPVPGASALIEL